MEISSKSLVYSLLLALVLLLSVGPAFSAERLRFNALKSGMTRSEVIVLLGPPGEREEFESKREEAWKYPGAELKFSEESLVSWYSSEAQNSGAGPEVQADTDLLPYSSQPKNLKKKSREAKIEQEVLDDILRSLPSEDAPKA